MASSEEFKNKGDQYKKILELIGDPDEGLSIREDLVRRLKKQREQVATGTRGKPLEDVIKELGLE